MATPFRQPLRAVAATKLFRAAVSMGQIRFTHHAWKEMDKDGITMDEAKATLKLGLVREAEWEHGEWRHHVERLGVTAVATIVDSGEWVVVITAWRKRRTR